MERSEDLDTNTGSRGVISVQELDLFALRPRPTAAAAMGGSVDVVLRTRPLHSYSSMVGDEAKKWNGFSSAFAAFKNKAELLAPRVRSNM